MALQSSGAISLANIQTEFGGSNPISISEYYGVGTVPASGTISLSDFYGQTAYSGPAGPIALTTSGTLTSGIDFPSGTNIRLFIAGGAGGGAGHIHHVAYAGGGHRGQIIDTIVNIPDGETVVVTIGAGGAGGGYAGGGKTGGSSIFGSYGTASGGAGGGVSGSTAVAYNGYGAAYVSPYDNTTFYDGYNGYGGSNGGQAGPFGNGGSCSSGDGTGYAGGVSGGGGAGHTGGAGGRGQIMLSWEN